MMNLTSWTHEEASKALSRVRTIEDLAAALGCSMKLLTFFAFRATKEQKYKSFTISKRNGSERLIVAPKPKLKNIQAKLSVLLEEYYLPRKAVHGYIKKKSIVTNARTHVNQKWLGKVDISDYFGSISTNRIVGLLCSAPFYLPLKVSATIALIVTTNGSLPLGSPCSPMLSNIITRRLDKKLSDLARKYKCYYSRYADDVFFSTNRTHFPSELLYNTDENASKVGAELEQVFLQEGFLINKDKTSLKNKSQRQLVTGIVVNEGLNVPREYVRTLRAMLYSWEKHGLKGAEAHWLKHYKNHNRTKNNDTPKFSWVVRGKLNHIAAVRGVNDELYLKYAKWLARIDSNFKVDPKAIAANIASEIHVYVEGKTDAVHLRAALSHFHSVGKFSSLKIKLINEENAQGDSKLKETCTILSQTNQPYLTICLFDADDPKIVRSMKGSALPYKDHGNNVFSVVIPNPDFRTDEKICIEHLYKDSDLKRYTHDGLRLYLADEFDPKYGFHKHEEKLVKLNPTKKTLIVDENVLNTEIKVNVALAKSKFAELIESQVEPFNQVSFIGFEPLLEIFEKLHSDYLQ